MHQITLKIDGMRCPMCEAHVCDAIRRALPQAKKVKASAHKGIATFLLEEEVDVSPAIAKIESTGYRILDQQSSPAKKSLFGR